MKELDNSWLSGNYKKWALQQLNQTEIILPGIYSHTTSRYTSIYDVGIIFDRWRSATLLLGIWKSVRKMAAWPMQKRFILIGNFEKNGRGFSPPHMQRFFIIHAPIFPALSFCLFFSLPNDTYYNLQFNVTSCGLQNLINFNKAQIEYKVKKYRERST